MSEPRKSQLVISGGGGGLAQAIAACFSNKGWEVHAPSREQLDVTDAHAVAAYFQDRDPDLLICNAGTIRDAPISKLTLADWQHVVDVNYHGAYRCAAAVLPKMYQRASGHIIFISSHSALHPPVGQAAYAAAKAALLGLTHDLACEAGPHNVRVNAVLPGFIETQMTASVTELRRKAVREAHLLGRFNTPDVIASFLWHLQQDLPHTSGQSFQLDSRPR